MCGSVFYSAGKSRLEECHCIYGQVSLMGTDGPAQQVGICRNAQMLGLPDDTVSFAVTEAYFPTNNITENVLLDALHINRGVINARCPEDNYNHKGR